MRYCKLIGVLFSFLLLFAAQLSFAQLTSTGAGKKVSGGGGTNIVLVAGQTTNNNSTSGGSTTTLTLTNNPTTNNLVAICVIANSADTTITIADSNSNNYTATTSTIFTGSAVKIGIYYLVAPVNASKTITVTLGVPVGFANAWAAEFSGANATPFERDATASFGGAGTTINTPSTTTTNNGDLLIGCAHGYNTVSTANSPWTGIGTVGNTTTDYAEYYIQTTAGAQAINFTQATSTFWDGMVAAFKK